MAGAARPGVAATVIIPTHNHGPTLRGSVESALRQTVPVEVFVVGDGASEETRAVARELAGQHERVRFFDHPKTPGRGELFRHAAIGQARGSIVCYLSDDDAYLPHHVEDMCALLEDADFVHALAVEALTDGGVAFWTVDLSLPEYQRAALDGINRVPLSAGAHTLSAYRQLSQGWTAAPPGTPSDLFMWQKFVRHPGCRFRPGRRPSVLVFPSPKRRDVPNPERLEEMRRWMAHAHTAEGLAMLNRRALDANTAAPGTPFLLQVFFPDSHSYSEGRSTSFPVRSGVWEKLRARIPCPALSVHPLRIDPADQACLIEIEQISVREPDGNLVWELTAHTAGQVRVGGTAAAIRRGPPLVVVSDGADPQIVLPAPRPAREAAAFDVEFTVRLDTDARKMAGLLAEQARAVQSNRVPLRRLADRLLRRPGKIR